MPFDGNRVVPPFPPCRFVLIFDLRLGTVWPAWHKRSTAAASYQLLIDIYFFFFFCENWEKRNSTATFLRMQITPKLCSSFNKQVLQRHARNYRANFVSLYLAHIRTASDTKVLIRAFSSASFSCFPSSTLPATDAVQTCQWLIRSENGTRHEESCRGEIQYVLHIQCTCRALRILRQSSLFRHHSWKRFSRYHRV